MVQIILTRNGFETVTHKQLYIPHGSDNTYYKTTIVIPVLQQIFISHMVQIILSLIVTLLKYCRFFISHMVQIIPDKISQLYPAQGSLLYIPHGSDNTW